VVPQTKAQQGGAVKLIDRLHAHREWLQQQQTEQKKGSIVVWLYVIEIAIQLVRLWRSK